MCIEDDPLFDPMEDLISQLPDVLLQSILLNVSTRDSVRTSVLSSRWRNLWKGVPGLHLIGDVYTNIDVIDFLERFLNLHKESSPIHQFTLKCNDKDPKDVHGFSLKWLIDKVITRGVECFAIDGSKYRSAGFGMINLPVSMYKCETLVHLWLEYVKLNDSEVFYLPRLETMQLESVWFYSDVVLEMLILCSPVLQVLSIHYTTTLGHLTLRSQTVKRLSLRRCFRHASSSSDGGDSGVVIDIPSLEFLCIEDDPLEKFRLESVSSSIKMCIDDTRRAVAKDNMSRMQAFHDFFAGISGVTDLTLSGYTLEGLYPHSQLPIFENLSHLNACFWSGFSEMLPTFLSSCPNLKSLDLWLDGYPNMKKIASSPVPQCFQTSIEYIVVKMTPYAGQERSQEAEIEFAKYILENATILKKLTLYLHGEEDESSSVLERVLTFANRSFVEVKMNLRPPKFRIGYGFVFTPFFDPIALFDLYEMRLLKYFSRRFFNNSSL